MPQNRGNRRAQKARYRKKYPEKCAAAKKRWQRKYPEKCAEHARRYRCRYPEKQKSRKQAYVLRHPEQLAFRRARGAAYRARKAGALVSDFTAKQWIAMKGAYGHRCAYCERKMLRLTMDHITPLSQGGSHTLANIIPACQQCNSKKNVHGPLRPVQPLLLL